jgi:hypothetical protein
LPAIFFLHQKVAPVGTGSFALKTERAEKNTMGENGAYQHFFFAYYLL